MGVPRPESTRARFRAVAAMAENRVIGKNNDLPWHLPEDFRWFKRLTRGSCVVMGRKTFESLDGALPERRNIVLSSSLSKAPEGTELATSVENVLEMTAHEPTVFIIGGAQVYGLFMDHCGQFFLTLVRGEYEGDRELPPFEEAFSSCEELFRTPEFVILRYSR